jgi:DNA-binding response OmpR family regulator
MMMSDRSASSRKNAYVTGSQHRRRSGATVQDYDCAVSEQTILVVDDEEAIAEAVRARLESEGYTVVVANDGPEAIRLHAEHRPDLVVLDLMLPGMDGIEVCKEIQRREWTPVLMLTARTDEADTVAGFAVGADDYLTKPFSLRELAARTKAILRRMERIRSAQTDGPIEHEGIVIDAARRRVVLDGEEVPLTPLEFEILHKLARDPGVVLSRDQLMDRVWGYRDYAGGRVVDSHVARIRRKLREDVDEPRFIRTVHGVGYAFME